MKDHEIASLVNELRDIALQYHDKQCLRDVISRAVRSRLGGDAKSHLSVVKWHGWQSSNDDI